MATGLLAWSGIFLPGGSRLDRAASTITLRHERSTPDIQRIHPAGTIRLPASGIFPGTVLTAAISSTCWSFIITAIARAAFCVSGWSKRPGMLEKQ
ncbi:hypothetical protein DQW77_14965 [Roseovarius sp. TE539]|nr:hypothetical protein DQW77_14965 [Roseovarius sp. TE539]